MAIATTAPYVVLFPLLLRRTLDAVPVPLSELVGRAFAPALVMGALLAAAVGGARVALSPDSLVSVAALALGGLAAYWAAYYVLVMDHAERALVRGLVAPVSFRASKRL